MKGVKPTFFYFSLYQVKTNKYGESPLHVAIKKGDYEKAKSLIEETDADVNMKDNAGKFCLKVKFTIDRPYSHKKLPHKKITNRGRLILLLIWSSPVNHFHPIIK